jgi:UDP-4-amino-4,6-dideoxy-N-acetyl-beta-L-altrosamine N-acetyltransferase
MDVSLRPVVADDKWQLLRWRNLDEVRKYMYTDHIISEPEHSQWFDKARVDPTRRDSIVLCAGEPIGLLSLTDINRYHQRCSWAYYLAEPSVRGQGIGSFVEYMAIEQAFAEERLLKLMCEVFLSNESVWRLHLRFGFRTEGTYRQHIRRGDGFEDVMALSLLASDWLAHRKDAQERLKAKGFALQS